jgi:predicted ABC-type ATPase
MIWIVGGINGAGKSTISTNPLFLTLMGVSSVVNPDEIAQMISIRQGLEYALANLCAAVMTQSMVFNQAVMAKDPSIAIETVLSSDKYLPILDIAEQRKLKVGLVYVALHSVDLSLARISTRVAAGLHDVPEETVRKRWPKTLANCAKWAPRVDRLLVVANNDVARGLKVVARKLAKTDPIEILDYEELPELVRMLQLKTV